MSIDPKTERVNLRVSPTEAMMLRELAEADGLAQSDVVRLLVRRSHADRFGAQKPKIRAPSKRPRRAAAAPKGAP